MELRVKVSDLVSKYLYKRKVGHVFTVSGGASLHLIHSVKKEDGIDFICCHHEQACAMAADSYSRVTGNIGVAIATSGPGATNLITGICCSYYDSVPLLIITGQVSTFRMKGASKVRQIGFQETPIIELCRPITKHCVQVTQARDILYELEKCFQIAISGRRGPVLIDIPDDIQREYIAENECKKYEPEIIDNLPKKYKNFVESIDIIKEMIDQSNRPVIIAGWGVHISKSEEFICQLAKKLCIPIALTWGAADLLPSTDPLYIGTFGTHGQRASNFAVQEADLILSFGTRLDTKATGTPINTFAPKAKKIILDIDESELDKFEEFGLETNLLICDDLEQLSLSMNKVIGLIQVENKKFCKWLNQIGLWKTTLNNFDEHHRNEIRDLVNPYNIFSHFSNVLPENTNIFFDTGCSVAWGMQSLKMRSSIRSYHDFNNTAMGWALPAAIGGYFAEPHKTTVCIVGDGSLMMTIEELAVIKRFKLPIKIFLMNNNGYSMIQQTQDQWLGSDYLASSYSGGLDFPEYIHIAKAYKMEYLEISTNDKLNETITKAFKNDGPLLCNVMISPKFRVIPQVKAGYPNEQMEPQLPIEITKLIDNHIKSWEVG